MPRRSQKFSGTTGNIAENGRFQKAESDSFGRAKKGAKSKAKRDMKRGQK